MAVAPDPAKPDPAPVPVDDTEGDAPNPRPSAFAVAAARASKIVGGNPHLVRTVLWIFLAGLTACAVGLYHGRDRALEFITAYIVEYSLSVDNLFVFLLIFGYFRVPRDAQETALNWGIIGACVLRGLMIVLGKALVERFEWISIFFAALLIYSAYKLLFEDDGDDEDLENNRIVRFAKRLLPVTEHYDGVRFFVHEQGQLFATPLFVVLVSIELSDVVFALDSVPAVLGISKDGMVVYASNIMAVMGLRSLFFVISDAITNLRFLQQSLAIVLGFIGVKMVVGVIGFHLPTLLSLGVVTGTLSGGVLLSVLFPNAEKQEGSDEEDEKPLSQVTSDVPPV